MINLNVTEQEVQIILAALAELRVRDGMPTYLSVQKQLEQHYKPSSEPVKEEAE